MWLRDWREFDCFYVLVSVNRLDKDKKTVDNSGVKTLSVSTVSSQKVY